MVGCSCKCEKHVYASASDARRTDGAKLDKSRWKNVLHITWFPKDDYHLRSVDQRSTGSRWHVSRNPPKHSKFTKRYKTLLPRRKTKRRTVVWFLLLLHISYGINLRLAWSPKKKKDKFLSISVVTIPFYFPLGFLLYLFLIIYHFPFIVLAQSIAIVWFAIQAYFSFLPFSILRMILFILYNFHIILISSRLKVISSPFAVERNRRSTHSHSLIWIRFAFISSSRKYWSTVQYHLPHRFGFLFLFFLRVPVRCSFCILRVYSISCQFQ